RVETPNATVYTQHYGVYRVTAHPDGWSEVVVRKGKAEVVTERGATQVRADEMAYIEGERYADIDVRSADAYDSLERWGRRMDEDYRAADLDYVDEGLRYAAAPLARHGSWIHVDNRNYWRPRVDSSWRPYWHGRWAYTPSGYTWISSEPWGWVPYHYGSWDYLPAYGWVWEPGYVYAPAWVYWYWGPSHVGWCPTGYYTRYYGPRYGGGFGFRFGVYGWAGGDWGYFDRWTFVGTDYFGRGYHRGYRDGYRDGRNDGNWDVRRHAVPIDQLRRVAHEMPRGIVTTDTRSITPDRLRDPQDVLRTLREQRTGRGGAADLPDVSSFVARRPQLEDAVRRNVLADANDNRLDGSPLKPGTLGSRNGRPSRDTVGGVLSGRDGDNRIPDPGKPRVVFGDDGRRPDVRSSRPEAGDTMNAKPNNRPEVGDSVRGSVPRAGRPSAGTDGGAPRPEVSDRVRREVGGSDSGVDRGTVRGTDRPAVREIPRAVRPDPSDDGGAPRPGRTDRPTLEVRPRPRSDDDGDRVPSARPNVRELPTVRDRERGDDDARPRSVDRPTVDRRTIDRYERPAERERPRPEPRSERPDPETYRRPETRSVPDRPTVRERDVERARPSSPPERERSQPSARSSEPRSRSNDNVRERVRESRPPRSRGNGRDQ
ncbi:MAG TPA: DUF6600 domain-containing protein, partial [Thermoanaerobaculia bacterium]|nr:DUF6600 domain-containing protein [Thermoanaerobaculia bacterium]